MPKKEAAVIVLGNAIKKARRDRKLSVERVAESLNIRWESVRRWESGINPPSYKYWPKIKKILGVDVENYIQRGHRSSMSTINISINRLTKDMPDRDGCPYTWDRYLLELAKRRIAEAFYARKQVGRIPEFNARLQGYTYYSLRGLIVFQYFWQYSWDKYLRKRGIRVNIVLKDEDETKDFFYED